MGGIVEEVTGYLGDSVSVHLVGLRQSGRSRVARLVADRLRERGMAVVVVSGVAALRDHPLAVLALAGVNIPSGAAASSISGAVSALSKLLTPNRSVLVIDDADDLDSVSSGAVAAAHARQPFPVLSVTRMAGRGQPTSRALTAGFQPGVRVTLDPLTFDQLHRVVHRMLPGPVDSATVARIATLSGGLPGLVRAIVDTGRRAETIVEEHTVWRARGDLWNGRLAQAVEPLLVDLTDDELDALTRLALTGTVTAPEAQHVVADQLFARLDQLGLLQVAQTPTGPLVGVFPPLVAEYLRRTGAAMSRLDAMGGVAAEASGSWGALTPRLTLTSSRAAILNMRIVEHWRVEVANARASWRAAPSAATAVPLLSALNAASAEASEFAAVLDGTVLDDNDPRASVRLVIWRAALQALVADDIDGACELLAKQQVRSPAFASQLRATQVGLRLLVGPMPDLELLAPAGPEEDPLGAEALATMRVAVLNAQGRTIDALAALPSYAPTYPYYVENNRISVGLARVLHGDFDDGVEWALRAMADAEAKLSLGEIHAHAYVAALGLTFAGRLDDLDALLGPVLTLRGTRLLSEHYQIGLLGLAALAASWRGRLDQGWSLSVQAETTGRRAGPFPGMLHGVTPTVSDPDRDWEQIGARLWRAVDERLAKGYVTAGVAVALTAVEIAPDSERAAAVVECARRAQSPFLAALGEYIAATAAGDPDALKECFADLWSRGARLHAIKAAVTCALVLRASGDIPASVRQAEQAWGRLAELDHGCHGLFFRLGDAVGLSTREREIAVMLGDGMTVPAIASVLSLSARTVENYLFSGCRKLGVEGRDDLVRAVATWAALGA